MEPCRTPFATPGGRGEVLTVAGRLVEVNLPPWDGVAPARASAQPEGAATRPACPEGARWAAELEAYFRGERRTWSAHEVDLDALGVSAFHREVYRALLDVPPGCTVSYGELARMAGRPGAARAVGSAMARNPIAIVVPCHRVVRSDGSLGRYGFGDAWKPYLLRFEGAVAAGAGE